jgi:CysZ protein
MLKKFFEGITSYGKAIKHISSYRMWGYVLVPGLISVLLGAAIFGLSWVLSDNVGGLIENLWRWEWGHEIVAKIAQMFGGLLVFLLGMIIFKQLVMVVSAPIMSILSEKVENQLVGKDSGVRISLKQIISDIVRGLKIALRNIFREIGATLLLLLFGLIPVFTPFSTILIFVLQAYYAGFGNLDFMLERHYRFRDSVKFVQNNRLLAIGNGAVFMLMLYTFVGFLFALPLGTVAATIAATDRIGDKP